MESDVFSIHLFSCGFGLFLSFFFIKRFLSRVESDVFSDRCFYNRCFFSCWIKSFFRTDFLINGVFSRFWVYFFLFFYRWWKLTCALQRVKVFFFVSSTITIRIWGINWKSFASYLTSPSLPLLTSGIQFCVRMITEPIIPIKYTQPLRIYCSLLIHLISSFYFSQKSERICNAWDKKEKRLSVGHHWQPLNEDFIR